MTNNPPSAQIKPGEYGFPLKLKARYDNFIGGEWVAPADGEYYQNLTPVTGQLLCEVASSGKRDIDLALDAAHKVKDKWAHTSVQERAAILFKIADRMEQNLELLATAETWDNGKPIRETSAADVPLAIDHFRYFASCIRAQEGGISEVDSETVAYHFHEPLGVGQLYRRRVGSPCRRRVLPEPDSGDRAAAVRSGVFGQTRHRSGAGCCAQSER